MDAWMSGGIGGGGRQNREKVESGFGVLGLEQPRKVLSGGDVKLQVLHVFSVLLWFGKEYFGVLWHGVISALCVLLCGVWYAVWQWLCRVQEVFHHLAASYASPLAPLRCVHPSYWLARS